MFNIAEFLITNRFGDTVTFLLSIYFTVIFFLQLQPSCRFSHRYNLLLDYLEIQLISYFNY